MDTAQRIRVLVAASIAGILAGIAIGAVFFFIHWKRKRRQESIKQENLELQQPSLSIRTASDQKLSYEGSQPTSHDPTTPRTIISLENYTLEELQEATGNFNLSNLIEGTVFHGRLKGKDLAIKSCSSENVSNIDFNLFHDSVPNMIKLLGTCLTEGPDSFLVLEYAKNGSLKDWIHGGLAIKSHFITSCDCFLTWSQRLKICLDVAVALQYMHHIMNPSCVHGSINSRNVFLDEEFNAKIGNLGMAKLVESGAEEDTLAPEYRKEGIIAPSVDIFGYGLVLLELLSGRRAIATSSDDATVVKLCDEIKVILELENGEKLKEWMDGSLGERYSYDAAVLVANLARSCVEDEPCLRPNSGEIVDKLLRLVEEWPP